MGFPVELFVDNPVNDEFICDICQDVLEDVVMLDPCEHVYCRSCITAWSDIATSCPIDRTEIQGHKPVQRVFTNALNNLRKMCPFREAGCDAQFRLGDLKEHEKNCQFNPNPPDHEQECPDGCGCVLKQSEMTAHNCVTYLKAELEKVKQEFADYKKANPVIPVPTKPRPQTAQFVPSPFFVAPTSFGGYPISSFPNSSHPPPIPPIFDFSTPILSPLSTPNPIQPAPLQSRSASSQPQVSTPQSQQRQLTLVHVSYSNVKGITDEVRDKIVKYVRNEASVQFPTSFVKKNDLKSKIQSKMQVLLGSSPAMFRIWNGHVYDRNGFDPFVPPGNTSSIDIKLGDLRIKIWS